MGRRLLRVTGELLVQFFQRDDRLMPSRRVICEGMPDDARLVSLTQVGHEFGTVDLMMVVESESFEGVPDGCTIPEFQVTCRVEYDGNLPMPAGAVSPLAAVAHLMGQPPDEPVVAEGQGL